MADLVKSGTPSLCSVLPNASANKITGLVAGEAVAAGDACYIKSDGKIWRSIGTSVNAAAKCDGFAPIAAALNDALTLVFEVNMNYGASLTPGARYYVGAAAGALADAPTTGGTGAVAFAIDTKRIRVFRSQY
jgi:hypothetical protein